MKSQKFKPYRNLTYRALTVTDRIYVEIEYTIWIY